MEEDQGNAGDKPYAPTAKKLEDARRKGNVPRSTDLNTAVAYAGLILAAALWGGTMLPEFGGDLSWFLSTQSWRAIDLGAGGNRGLIGGPVAAAGASLAPLFLVPWVLVLVGILGQRALIFYGGNLEPKLSRLNPIENAKKKYGRKGLFEFFKSFLKLLLFASALIFYVHLREADIVQTAMLEPGGILVRLAEIGFGFLLITLGIAVALGLLDLTFQQAEHLRSLRMTHKEMMDELKNTEGDPTVKAKRRQRGMEIAHVQALQDVQEADVVVVNPEHYAVALKWSRAPGSAPVCVAKGVDELALTIRRLAADHEVPIYPEPPTARALYATVEIGQEIPGDLYGPVAAAIRFAEAMREKSRKRAYGPSRPLS